MMSALADEMSSLVYMMSALAYVMMYLLHCFVTGFSPYLQQDYKVEIGSSDPDPEVNQLNKFLSQLEEKVKDFLPSTHTKLVFYY